MVRGRPPFTSAAQSVRGEGESPPTHLAPAADTWRVPGSFRSKGSPESRPQTIPSKNVVPLVYAPDFAHLLGLSAMEKRWSMVTVAPSDSVSPAPCARHSESLTYRFHTGSLWSNAVFTVASFSALTP
ncbi:hypothetical protein C0Q70_14310 [Pomacea canaliculata]|uniref:Uncharacterized protein n=1 Tax=Pomacea canaliculata TaxID=400727 RepID=A0A2T7NZM6_POMCA|nr:hypothetical protein C0Q70_14310 [Pomacea canaliculata]